MSEQNPQVRYPHHELIQEHNINVKQLPMDLRKEVNSAEAKRRFAKQPFKINEAIVFSAQVAHKLQDFLDNGSTTPIDPALKAQQDAEAEQAKLAAEAKEKADAEAASAAAAKLTEEQREAERLAAEAARPRGVYGFLFRRRA